MNQLHEEQISNKNKNISHVNDDMAKISWASFKSFSLSNLLE